MILLKKENVEKEALEMLQDMIEEHLKDSPLKLDADVIMQEWFDVVNENEIDFSLDLLTYKNENIIKIVLQIARGSREIADDIILKKQMKTSSIIELMIFEAINRQIIKQTIGF